MLSKKMFSTLLFSLTLGIVLGAGTDMTMTDKAYGVDVVDAVIEKIHNVNFFTTESGILKRIAFMESKFGEDPNTFAPRNKVDYFGGIWQVDAVAGCAFAESKNVAAHPTLPGYYAKINQTLGIDWSKVTWTDCQKPLISGLAASLGIIVKNVAIPTTLEGQSNYWFTNYNSAATKGTAAQFYDSVRAMEKQNKCFGRMDLAIVMDGSGSITAPNFELAKKFVSDLIGTFSPENVNVGFIVFSQVSQIIFPLDSGMTLAQMQAKVIGAVYPGQGTNTSGAIPTAVDMLFRAKDRAGSPKIMTVFTDGVSDTPVTAEVAKAKARNLTTFAIGIGSGINQAQLLEIAFGDQTHVLTQKSYKELSESFETINSYTCNIHQDPDVGKQVVDHLTKDEKRFFCYVLPVKGITVSIDVVVGKTNSFYSYTSEHPSSALNDGIVDGKKYIAQSNDGKVVWKRVCITIKGIEVNNNYTIKTDEGNSATVAPTTLPTPSPTKPSTQPPPQPTTQPPITKADDDDKLWDIKKNAENIARKAFNDNKDYNSIANQLCNELSKTYRKEEWVCIVGEKVEISEHIKAKSLFQIGFQVEKADVYIIVNVPDQFR